MKFLKPIFWLIFMNVAVMGSLTLFIFILGLFGIHINQSTTFGLLIVSAVIGISSAIISLFLSRWIAKKNFGIQLVDKNDQLYKIVEELAQKANIPMPEVGIFNGPANAFATGPNKNHSLVAVSTELLRNFNEDEIKGVLAHEIGHIKNGDMITMTILEAILNTFVYFFAEIIASLIADKEERFKHFILSIGFQIVFGLFASMIAMWFSRHREYKADESSVILNGKNGLKNALYKLSQIGQPLPAKEKAFGIFGFGAGLTKLFASHPSIEKRIKHIEEFNS